ncbi:MULTISPECIES: DUF2382 domain-containing protein [unclassified Leptolyngbya]|uniref:DUF2382 domain-containing protein n=1 Tax=unclassified Leptolyngbya TaxID=2650499 RepID=UPI0016876B86|nr:MULTISPECIES: DUF2382 domain-containing protein [unclassified Leptolyngbya]MBD1909563.1 DUF2382 domain-containing protein [Leptolyngbya sp. FACHB-8]MBD2154101.1 DUF2382 domain-containing protein [Leptolyngbya sp. FACHB-16]
MQAKDGRLNSRSDLTGNLVYDRNGYLVGEVVGVNETTADQFSLIVDPPHTDPGRGQISIDGSLLSQVDSATREVRTNFDYNELVSPREQCFQLLEEQLVVNRKRVKLGEVVIRKVIETQMVEIPVQREKLVVQKIGENQSLFELPLGETNLHGQESALQRQSSVDPYIARGQLQTIQDAVRCLTVLARSASAGCRRIRATLFLKPIDRPSGETVHLEFETPGTAASILGAIAPQSVQDDQPVTLDLVLEDETAQSRYQRWFDEYSRVITR